MRFVFQFLFFWVLSAISVQAKDISIKIPHGTILEPPMLNIYIEESGPYKFLIDTGSTHSSLSKALAKELNIERDKSLSETLTFTAQGSRIQTFSNMQTIRFHDVEHERQTRFDIAHDSFGPGVDGILGLAALYDAQFINHPDAAYFEIILDDSELGCDSFTVPSKCAFNRDDIPFLKAQIGSQDIRLLLDTGYNGRSSLFLFKSNLTNKIWETYYNQFETETLLSLSDLPVGHLFTKDFDFNGNKSCFADFFIRDPKDKTEKLSHNLGLLGWDVIMRVPFQYNVRTGFLIYPTRLCPFKTPNTLGILSLSKLDTDNHVYINGIASGSPADKAGLKNWDIVEKFHFPDGSKIVPLSEEFIDRMKEMVNAPDGTLIILEILRDDEIIAVPVTTKGPNFLDLSPLK